MRFAELFAGAGGLSMGLEAAGHICVWHCEIEPHACAVLRHQWPDVPLYGDVSQLDGRELVERHGPIELLSGGSPCQDLSVAGKRAGLAGGRSGLFHEQVRLWRETEAPVMLWENVPGALSASNGEDFHVVLSTLAGATVPVTRKRDGKIKWPKSGIVRGPDGRARVAYRVLDLQWFGPPQRRRRVFLLAVREDALDRYDPAALLFADAAGGCTGADRGPEIFAVREGVSGHHPASGGTGEGVALSLASRTRSGERVIEVQADIAHALKSGRAGREDEGLVLPPAVFEHHGQDSRCKEVTVASTFGTNKGKAQEGRLVVPAWWDGREVTPTLSPGAHNAAPGLNGQDQAQWAEAMYAAQLVKGQMMPDKDRLPVVMAMPGTADTADTLLGERYDSSPCVDRGQPAVMAVDERNPSRTPRPRRLTPTETERLMGWPDGHTAHGVKENGTRYALPDSARYRLCGNGVGSPCTAWIGDLLNG